MSPSPSPSFPDRAVFLDRDGTLIVERHYLSDPNQVELIPGVPAALGRLQAAGFSLIVATNQSGIGRGYYTCDDMHQVNARLAADLACHGIRLRQIYFSPEAPEEQSYTRKPLPGMLEQARAELGIHLGSSYMVGDKLADVECGWNAGVRASLLVRTGYGSEHERQYADRLRQAIVVDDLVAAADWILRDEPRKPSPPG